jgi:hypothetical protein
MRKNRFLALVTLAKVTIVTLALAFALALTGCETLLDIFSAGASSYYGSSGCQGDGDCVLITDSNGDGAYSWCYSTSCRVGTTLFGTNQNIRCNCN